MYESAAPAPKLIAALADWSQKTSGMPRSVMIRLERFSRWSNPARKSSSDPFPAGPPTLLASGPPAKPYLVHRSAASLTGFLAGPPTLFPVPDLGNDPEETDEACRDTKQQKDDLERRGAQPFV